MVLYVQEEWGVHLSSFASLQRGRCIEELHFYIVWDRVGYAETNVGFVDMPGWFGWVWSSEGSLEVVRNVVYLEGEKCTNLRMLSFRWSSCEGI